MAGSRKTTPLAKAAMSNQAVWRPDEPVFSDDEGKVKYKPQGDYELPATPHVIDFVAALKYPEPQGKSRTPRRIQRFIDERPENDQGLVLTQKQIRARARRAAASGRRIPKEERDLVWKPIEDWDIEELSRGRPRAADGTFKGRTPAYVTREVSEQALDMFKRQVRLELNGKTVDALAIMSQIMGNDDVDEKGKPLVPASTKMDGAKFLIEHVIGKAVQPTTNDVSVKLQGILGMALVNPTDEGYALAHVGQRGGSALELTASDEEYEDAEVLWDDNELDG